ncbi:hypothetical protein SELSPUOL_00371 [Selenomonas sputigena ATCC 35185]|uniref:Uncharacterized protein n=1 Tax=Selenomonas sputigena (strain ATCC 35185 / DSM 20758 / CCUG 44933 / VPI D19B-28) TaxID=546271 RepID=C9LSE7_SELS3|nr:hypothetical protein SELSPUOL_00371 [Selenomonas sputigena ATCC 35185]
MKKVKETLIIGESTLGNADKMKSPRFAQMRCIYRGDILEA